MAAPAIAETKKEAVAASASTSAASTSAASTTTTATATAIAGDVASTLRGTHLLSVRQWSRAHVDCIFGVANAMGAMVEQSGSCDLAKGRLLVNLFYEPSTRTSSSFHAAMLRLGGMVLPVTDVANSSVAKGETLGDTVRALQSYADVIVLRHPVMGSAKLASDHLYIPLINAGDGVGEHPTQALLDCYTMIAEFGGSLDGLTITMVGDLKHGRTVHSLARLLQLFSGITINYVSPDFLRMPAEVTDEVKAAGGVKQCEHTALDSVLASTDVLYVTRVQKERFSDPAAYERACSSYTITPELLTRLGAKSSLRILHPLPRVGELSPELDRDPRAAYFRQMRYGLFVRMALLALVLGVAPKPVARPTLAPGAPAPVAVAVAAAAPAAAAAST